MTDTEVEVRTLSRLGYSVQGIADLTGYPFATVRALVYCRHDGGKRVRKCASPPGPVDRRYLAGLPVAGYVGPRYAVPHEGDRVEGNGPVRVIYHHD